MKRFRPALVATLFLLLFAPRAEAQIPVTDVAHIAVSTYEGILRYVQAAYSIFQRAASLYNQYRQIVYQITALKKLSVHSWRDLGPLYNQLNGILYQAGTLTYALDNLEEQFYATFPGATRYINFPTESFTRVTRVLDTLRLDLQSLHQIHEDQQGSLQVLGQLQAQVDAAEGHQQVQEAQAELLSWQASQLATINSTLQALANSQIVHASYVINQDAQERQSQLDLWDATLTRAQADHADTYKTFTLLPDWMP